MKIITTRYFGPSVGRGARIVARGPAGTRRTISYPHELHHAERHRAACRALAEKMGWTGRVHEGIADDNSHIFLFESNDPQDSFVI